MHPAGRHGARRLLLQALYQHQIAGHDAAALIVQFSGNEHFGEVDEEYFENLLCDVLGRTAELDQLLDPHLDRPIVQLDPIERAILWLGTAEFSIDEDVPSRVIIDEAVELAKEFGSQDGYRYVNAILDKLARVVRTAR